MNIYNIESISKVGAVFIVKTENGNRYTLSVESCCDHFGLIHLEFTDHPDKFVLVDNGDIRGLEFK